MLSVGQRLRNAREAAGLSIPEIATRTRISARYLEAIEADDLSRLPGGFFYKSFVQQYALAVGLDPNELKPAVDQIIEPEPDEGPQGGASLPPAALAPIIRRDPLTARLWFRLLLLGLMIVACSGIYSAWKDWQSRPLAPAAAATTAAAPEKPQPQTPATPQNPAVPVPPPGTNTAAAPAANTVPSPNGKITLHLAANDKAWVQLKGDGKTLFVGLLEPPATKDFDGVQSATLLVGNAGGVDVTFNGKPIGAIGPKGQVRTVVFSPDKFEVQLPAPKVPATGAANPQTTPKPPSPAPAPTGVVTP